MENKNNNGILLLLLIFIILSFLFGGYIVYDKVLSKNGTPKSPNANINTPSQQENISINNYTYDGIAGYYTGSLKDEPDSGTEGDDGTTNFSLELNSNGTFSFRQARFAASGFIGNYIIKDNQIILNHLYSTNSGASKNRTNGTTTVTIDSNGSLKLTAKGQGGTKEQELTLAKDTNASNENQFEHYLSYEGN